MRVAALWRHPIKSCGAEPVESFDVTEGRALPWDRRFAIAHERSEADGRDWAACGNFVRGAKVPGLMAVTARTDETTGRMTLTHPGQEPLDVDPAAEGDALVAWARRLVPPGGLAPARLVPAETQAMTDTPYPSISLANLATLDEVSRRAGRALDPRRFRANIWIENAEPWSEFTWLRQSLKIGSAVFRVEERIGRCQATSADPETGARDLDMLQVLEDGWGHGDFGVYLVAERSGRIARGDVVVPA